MGLIEELLEVGKSIINSDLVSDARTTFGLKRLISESGTGVRQYSGVQTYEGVVNLTSKQVMMGAQLVLISGSILVTSDIPSLGVVTKPPRLEPVDIRDIVIVNGREFSILSVPNSIKLDSGPALIKILLK
jgi:hypothetical protein